MTFAVPLKIVFRTPSMPIRGLDETRKQAKQNFLLKIPQGAFKKMRICIDGNWFLRKYANIADIHRAFLFGMEEMIGQSLLKLIRFKEANEIDLMWVWDGIDFERPQATNQISLEASVEQGFREYAQKNYSKAGKFWRNLVVKKSEIETTNRILEENGVSVVTAPYSATAQCAYFMSAGACSYIFGKSDVLLFEGVDKVILDIFDEEGKATYLDVFHKNRFLEFFSLSPKLFSILGLLLGCDFCPTIPKCANDFSFDKVFMLIQGSEDLVKAIKNSCEEDVAKKYIEQLFKGLALITYLPVMKTSGSVQPYSEDHVPKNLDKLIGARLAPGFYEAMFLNKISYTLLNFLGKEKSSEVDPKVMKMAETMISKMKKERGQGKIAEDHSSKSAESLFVSSLCPSISVTGDLDSSTEFLLMLSIHLNQLESPFVPKLLCLLDQPSVKDELKIKPQTLRYYIGLSQLFNTFRELREMAELLGGRNLGGLFSRQPVLFSSSFHETFGESGISGKNNLRFLTQVQEFLKANQKFSPIVANIIEEIGVTLKNKN